MGLDADLTAYYEAEAGAGRRADQRDFRVGLRQAFAEVVRREQRSRLVDVGAGPGLDVAAWQADGFRAVGVDLACANVGAMRRRGLSAVAASLYQLPFPDATFDAVWSMSTFVHVPHHRFDEAIAELGRVVVPGGLMAVGTWGGIDFEGVPEFGDLRPFRFFSLASHRRWKTMLSRSGEVEQFATLQPHDDLGWEYQFAVLRMPS